MAYIILKPGWQGNERDVTPRHIYQNRRAFIKKLSLGTIGVAAGTSALVGCANGSGRSEEIAANAPDGPLDTIPEDAPRTGFPAPRNERFEAGRSITDRLPASSYNNFYEFKNQGNLKKVWPLTEAYDPFPWTLEITGAVEKEFTLDLERLLSEVDLEEASTAFAAWRPGA